MPETSVLTDSNVERRDSAQRWGALGGTAGEPPFSCTWRGDVGVGWVRLAGELDPATSPQLKRTLRKALSNARLVILDLRTLTFMDTAGLHIIVDASVRAQQQGRRLIVVRGPAEVDALFDMTGAAKDVEILDLQPMELPTQALLQLSRKHFAV